ncbi:hypothetical protein [Streptomyces sp. NPDC005283]|uniref:DUF7848 domain-containing protein n=1 Tax=Streptomyces sp. NPDC005283 TaxID=3156871 RepID=UPI00345163F1
MTARSVIKLADWILGIDRTPGASGPIFELACTTCDEASDASDGKTDPELWALGHTGRHTGHRSFRSTTTAFFRTVPAPGNPLYRER